MESARVEAYMKKLPQLLPRGTVPEKTSPPCLAQADSGSVQVTLPITVTTIPSQPGSTVPLMILPSGMSLSYPEREKTSVTVTTSAAPTPVVQRARPAAPKRGPDPSTSVSAAGVAPKRKRGRPRKPRPEDVAPQVQSAPTSNPNPALLTRGVIQKAMPSCAPATPSQLVEIVIQDQPGLMLSQLPTIQEVTDAENRGIMVQCQPVPEPEKQQSVLLMQDPNQHGFELTSRRMVIQRAPLYREGRPVPLEVPQSALSYLPPATLLEDRGEVEITLTPVEPHADSTPNSAGISSCFGSLSGETPKPDAPWHQHSKPSPFSETPWSQCLSSASVNRILACSQTEVYHLGWAWVGMSAFCVKKKNCIEVQPVIVAFKQQLHSYFHINNLTH